VGVVNSRHDSHSIAFAEFLFSCFTLSLALGASAVSLASFIDVASEDISSTDKLLSYLAHMWFDHL
jgi:hypothetical protein